jgi:hypothetical protein
MAGSIAHKSLCDCVRTPKSRRRESREEEKTENSSLPSDINHLVKFQAIPTILEAGGPASGRIYANPRSPEDLPFDPKNQ